MTGHNQDRSQRQVESNYYRRLRGGAESGFSLLEVLIATTIIGLTLIALMQLLLVGFKAKTNARQRTAASLLGEKILQVYSNNNKLTSGQYQGQWQGYRFQVQIEPQYEIFPADPKTKVVCYLIHVSIAWLEKGKTKSIDLETMKTIVQSKT
jgi:prepilin-type N-terminal cleavage/methylation domain-containing protein